MPYNKLDIRPKTPLLALSPIGGFGGFNTSAHRIRAMVRLGFEVCTIDSAPGQESKAKTLAGRVRNRLFRLGLPVTLPDYFRDRARLLQAAKARAWSVIWLERALTVDAPTMLDLKRLRPHSLLVGFSPDDMNARHNQSQQFVNALPYYDAFVTTKNYNVGELTARGCRRVLFVDNGYDPESFRPLEPSLEERFRFEADVGFIGMYERERAASMLYLARNGIQVRVWGWGWQRMRKRDPNLKLEMQPLYGDDFAKACSTIKINLGFLRKLNRDQQTTRSVEIPACGGFMLAERTAEHRALFEEGVEAEFFSSDGELLAKVRRYLSDASLRRTVASKGLRRCETSGYCNEERLRTVFEALLPNHQR